MNTKIYYLYRDASNYKVHNTAVVEGEFSDEDIDTIMDTLDLGELFIPQQVGLPAERFSEDTEDDHPFFEIDEDSFEITDEDPDVQIFDPRNRDWRYMTSRDLVENFREAGETGWDAITYSGDDF